MKISTLGSVAIAISENKVLLHGDYNTGKTHIAGSFLAWHAAQDRRVAYLYTTGEPGVSTLSNFVGVPIELYEMEKPSDILLLKKDLKDQQFDAVAFDSFSILGDQCIDTVTGGVRAPGQTDDRGKTHDGRQEWGYIKEEFRRCLATVKKLAPHVMVVGPSAVSTSEVTKTELIAPFLPGQLAQVIVGMFDLVGYLEIFPVAGRVERKLHFEPMGGVRTRANSIKTAFTGPISLKTDSNSWEQIETELAKRR